MKMNHKVIEHFNHFLVLPFFSKTNEIYLWRSKGMSEKRTKNPLHETVVLLQSGLININYQK